MVGEDAGDGRYRQAMGSIGISGISGIGEREGMGEGGDDTGRNERRAAAEHGIGRRASGKLAS
jgi:hypothetical protein